jgi:hypothetical protein
MLLKLLAAGGHRYELYEPKKASLDTIICFAKQRTRKEKGGDISIRLPYYFVF